MSGPVEDFEAGEQLLILAVVSIGGYLLYRAYQKLTQDSNAVMNGAQSWVGNNQPLSYPHAQGIAQYIGVDAHGGGWSLSPDGMQVWFYDTSFYDNVSGNYYDNTGKLVGNLVSQMNSQNGQPGVGIFS